MFGRTRQQVAINAASALMITAAAVGTGAAANQIRSADADMPQVSVGG